MSTQNKDMFVLIPLCSLSKIWEKDWRFSDLFDIGMYITAKKLPAIPLREQVDIVDKYGGFSNIICQERSEENWVDDVMLDVCEQISYCDVKYRENVLYAIRRERNDDVVHDWCKIQKVCQRIRMDYVKTFDILYNAYEKIGVCNSAPYILVSATIMKNFVSADRHCLQMDRMRRMMYLGISSIVGRSAFMYTTSDMIKARMFGFLTPDKLKEYYDAPEHEAFRELYDKFTTRRRYDYMLKDLQTEGLIGEIGYKRRTIVSLRIKEPDELLTAITSTTKAARRRELTEKKKAAFEQHRRMEE